ncbi:hypothetical protein B0H12DRAFT_1134815 [Mycena haematopus]|nr:hypothetical protein B0H12DRAFT_1134815 [Mycena haematopus]
MLKALSANPPSLDPGNLSDSDSDVQIVSAPQSRAPSPIVLNDSGPPSPRVPATRPASRSPEGSEENLASISEPVSSSAVHI